LELFTFKLVLLTLFTTTNIAFVIIFNVCSFFYILSLLSLLFHPFTFSLSLSHDLLFCSQSCMSTNGSSSTSRTRFIICFTLLNSFSHSFLLFVNFFCFSLRRKF
jgi:hypothetical protein